jgi:DNA-binding response OmpR family regulator
MKNNLLIFGTSNFNNSLNEIKEYLDFSLLFYKKDSFPESSISTIKLVLVDADFNNNTESLNIINKIKNIPILILEKKAGSNTKIFKYSDKILLPLSLVEFNNHIKNLIISAKFILNSSIKIKDYTIDKNEKLLKKGNLFTSITEREIDLIELLYNEIHPVSKNVILKKIWNYSVDADTHTIETHIHRLRKKILNKFNEENFIIYSKSGYSI